jgi:hypothetical protein
VSKITSSYDVAYQDWVVARKKKDYAKSDAIRIEFERCHGLTIFAEGEMPITGVTVRRMLASDWEMKYGNPKLGEAIRRQDSAIKRLAPEYQGRFKI